MQIMLPPKSVRLHETAPTMEAQSVINRMYGMYNVRPGYFYPQSPYARSLGVGGLRGLGFSYYDLLAQAGLENCDPKDTPCVSRNQQRQVAVEDLWVSNYMTHPEVANQTAPSIDVNVDTSPQAVAAFKANQPLTSETISVNDAAARSVFSMEHVPAPSWMGSGGGSGGGSGSPRVSFRTSTGDTGQLKPGDSWTIDITGGAPNAPVTVTGGQNGANVTTNMGSTDSGGNWHASGSIDTTMLGNWAESWAVGGQNAGSFSFTVVAATQAQGSANTGKPNQSVPPGNALVPGNTGFNSTGNFFQALFGGTAPDGSQAQPNYLLLAALGIGAVLLLKGK